MIELQNISKFRIGLAPLLLAALLTGCGGEDPILGTPNAGIAPTVAITLPLASTPAVTGVATNGRLSVTFSKPMDPGSITPTSFTVACPSGAPVTATVAYNATTQVATLTPAQTLPPSTLCLATVTTAVKDITGLALTSNYAWSFTTSALADATRPTVILTAPAAGDGSVAVNRQINATFSESMDAATISGASFTVTNTTLGTPVVGTVSYSPSTRTATFTPSTPAVLAASDLFTAVISTATTDLAGNTLAGNAAVLPGAGNHVWTFTTAAGGDAVAPTISTTSPVLGATGVCTSKIVSATFSEPMDVSTFNTSTFRVTDSGVAVAGTCRTTPPPRSPHLFPPAHRALRATSPSSSPSHPATRA